MLLAVDIGNTNIDFGVFRGRRLARRFRHPTYLKIDSASEYSNYLKKNLFKHQEKDIDCVIICSVVPSRAIILQRAIRLILKAEILVLGRDIEAPINNLYKAPKRVGQDRMVNAYAGLKLYGSGLILVDFGTAITFDIVSRKGDYVGGLIHPGLSISLKALHGHTALLPEIEKKLPGRLIGQNTKESMLSGVIFGAAEMCDGLIRRLRRKCKNFKAIATGGDSKHIRRYCKNIDKFDQALTLKGIMFIYRFIKGKG
jgi:type III pantothenate kinase